MKLSALLAFLSLLPVAVQLLGKWALTWKLSDLEPGVPPPLWVRVEGFLPHLRGRENRAPHHQLCGKPPPGPQAWKRGTRRRRPLGRAEGPPDLSATEPHLPLTSSLICRCLFPALFLERFPLWLADSSFQFLSNPHRQLLSVFGQKEGGTGVSLHGRSKDGSQIVPPPEDSMGVLELIFFSVNEPLHFFLIGL